jgi:AcrR family transcriptional regulator
MTLHADRSDVPASSSQAKPISDKREALLRAALELFAERTYGATPVPDIAARAHVGTGTVYRHFASKEALANAVFRQCKTAMHESLRTALTRGGSEKERFLGMWRGLSTMATADPTALRFLELQHHEDYLDDESRALSDTVFTTAQGFIRNGQVSGAIREGDPAVAIALLFGAFVGLFKEACLGRYVLDENAVTVAGECAWRMIARDR